MKIEQNIEIPEVNWGNCRGRPLKYPFPDMNVGDSIFFPDEPKGSQSKPASAARMYGMKYGKKFSVRSKANGVRIWRIK